MTRHEIEQFLDLRDGDRVWVSIRRMEPDGRETLIRRNIGFNALELGGLAALASLELVQHWTGEIRPDVIKREVSEQGMIERDKEDKEVEE